MSLVCKVIGYTKFLGVPESLFPDDTTIVAQKKQDMGSEGARLIECGGRVCYDSYGVGRPSSEYHEHIKQVGHGSVTEHFTINFLISGVSRGLTHELVRHRHASISQRSTRYVDESESDWIIHPLIIKMLANGNHLEVGTEIQQIINLAKGSYKLVAATLEKHLMEQGADKITARKQARGAARGLLGNSLSTELVWSINVRSLRNFLEQRASPHADAEIRRLANKLYEAALAVIPEYFNDYEKVDCPDGIGYGLVTKYRKI